jgi:NitT/TauT family transport system permease protein
VLINCAKTFGASEWQIFTKVCVPSSMNMVFAGIRISLGNSWSTLVAAEMLASIRGLGYMIQMGRTLIRPDIIIVGMLTIGCTGALMGWILGLFEKKIAPWRYK